MRFRGVPLHSWNYHTFVQIGKACSSFMAITRETMEMEILIEAFVKIIYNYYGFFPTSILIRDDEGQDFVVQTVPPP